MEFNFRIATKKDKDKIFFLVQKLAESERKKTEEIGLTLDKIATHGFGKNKYFYVLLAEYEQEPAGFALYFYTYSASLGAPVLYLEEMFVAKNYQSEGLGTALLAHLAHIAVEKQCCRMEGHAFTWNKKFIKFYELLGAVPRTDLLQFRLSDESLETLAKKSS